MQPDRGYVPVWKRMNGPNSTLGPRKYRWCARTVPSTLDELALRPFGLSPEHTPAVLKVGFDSIY